MIMIDRCRHGLCRNCHLCHYEKEIARLNAENEQLKSLLHLPKAIDSTEQPSNAGADSGSITN